MVDVAQRITLTETVGRIAATLLTPDVTLSDIAKILEATLLENEFGDYEVTPLPEGCEEFIIRTVKRAATAIGPVLSPRNVQIYLAPSANLRLPDLSCIFGSGLPGVPLFDTDEPHSHVFYLPNREWNEANGIASMDGKVNVGVVHLSIHVILNDSETDCKVTAIRISREQ